MFYIPKELVTFSSVPSFFGFFRQEANTLIEQSALTRNLIDRTHFSFRHSVDGVTSMGEVTHLATKFLKKSIRWQRHLPDFEGANEGELALRMTFHYPKLQQVT